VPDVLGQAAPGGDPVERRVAVAPGVPVLDPCGDGQAEVGDGSTVGREGDLGVVGQVANDGDVGVGHQVSPPGARWVLLAAGSRWWSGRWPGPPSSGGGSAGAGGGGGPRAGPPRSS